MAGAEIMGWGLLGLICLGLGLLIIGHDLALRFVPLSPLWGRHLGFSKLVGKTRSMTPLMAPLTGRPCVLWQVTLGKQISSNTYRDVAVRWSSEPPSFELADPIGPVTVVATDATLILETRSWTNTAGGDLDLPATGQEMLHEHGLHWDVTGVFREGVRVKETRIEVGATVTALGRLESCSGGSRRRLVAPTRWYEPNLIATPEAARVHQIVHGVISAPFLLAGLGLLIVQILRAIVAASS